MFFCSSKIVHYAHSPFIKLNAIHLNLKKYNEFNIRVVYNLRRKTLAKYVRPIILYRDHTTKSSFYVLGDSRWS